MARYPNDDSRTGSFVGIVIPALVIIAAIAGYFLYSWTDNTQVSETNPPATTTQQPAPKQNPDTTQVRPESEQKPPPADTNPADTDPRVDSQNAN